MTSTTSPADSSGSLEDALQDMFTFQSRRLTVPNTRSNDLIAEPLLISTTTVAVGRSQTPLVLAAAASIVVALAFVGIATGSNQPNEPSLAAVSAAGDDPSGSAATSVTTTEPTPVATKVRNQITLLKPFSFRTKTVRFEADQIQLTYDGETFDYSITIDEGEIIGNGVLGFGEAGIWQQSTNLRLVGDRDRVPVLVEFDFESDGIDWWAAEIRTSYGEGKPDWVRETGQFFRTPLGTGFTGDLALEHLEITGLEVEAFRKPLLCSSPKHELVIDFDDPYATIHQGLNLDYLREPMLIELGMQAFNSESCAPTAVEGLIIDVTVDDSSILTVENVRYGDEVGVFSIQVLATAVGRTRINLVVRDPAGTILADQSFPAQAWPISDADLEDYLSDPEAEPTG